jgi:hypothetical protein
LVIGYNSSRLARLVNEISMIVRAKHRIKLAELALQSGYSSIEYFKRSVLPAVLQLNDCVRYNKEDKTVEWICVEGGDGRKPEN